MGIPLAEIFTLLRTSLNVHCDFCLEMVEVLRQINSHPVEVSQRALENLLQAKQNKDYKRLGEIKKEFSNGQW